jgi:uncharacterized repeat protein (TIGR03803 family)
VVHSSPGGYSPAAGLIFDAAGNLYGTTQRGGFIDQGTAFELTPTGGGGWTGGMQYSFNDTDGQWPYAGLILDAAGNVYGTTNLGGNCNEGTAFELTPEFNGWQETVLYNFCGIHGAGPGFGSLIFDAGGNLYGTTTGGGTYGGGTVFELTPTAGGGWTEQPLYNFSVDTGDGWYPLAGLIFDAAGNLYGTTQQGGTNDVGTVFELTPTAGGGWTETVLHSFGNGTDGQNPYAGLIFDAAGNLYGTTWGGGFEYQGTAFELTPVRPCAKCSHSMLREGDVLPAERRDMPEQGGIERR